MADVWGETPPLGHVLVVDDEVPLMSVLCEMLSAHGFDVVGRSSGPDGLDVLRERDIDVLLADLMMPEMDGVQLLRSALEVDPHVIGIIMTGQGTVSTAVEAMKTGAFDYLLKPFRMEALLPVLSRAMEVRRLRLENVRLNETVAIYELAKTVAYVLDPDAILDKLADGALQQCQGDEASVMLPTADGAGFYIAAVRGEHRDHILGERVPLDRGIAGWVARHLEPMALQGGAPDLPLAPLIPRSDLRSAISMPLLVGGKLIGVLNVSSKQRRPFPLGQVKALSILTTAGAGALEHARLYTATRTAERRYRGLAERLAAISGFASTISSTLDLQRLFDLALQHLAALTACSWCNINEYDRPSNTVRLAAVWRREGEGTLKTGDVRSVEDSYSGFALHSRRTHLVQDTHLVPRPAGRARTRAPAEVRSRIIVPILIGDDFWGTLGVGFMEPGAATPERVDFLEAMAAHLAVAIHNAELYSEAREAHAEVWALNEQLERRVEERTGELVAANELVGRERALLSAIVASMSDGLMFTDLDLNIRFCNEHAVALLDSPGPLEGRTVLEAVPLLRPAVADVDEAFASWDRLRSTGGSFPLTVLGPPQRDLLVAVFPVTDQEGRAVGAGTILRDVSSEREIERMKDELVSVVSHELRTPLASLVGFADLLLSREYDEARRRQFLTVIREEGHRLTALINDLLDLQKLESGRAMISPAAAAVPALIERAVASAPGDLQDRIRLEIPDHLPLIRADQDAIHQVLGNLLSNAVKYSPDGADVCIEARPEDAALRISVVDQGLGIPAEALPRVFDKFYRVDNSDRREIKGTGLGLAICRQIVAAHGGRIWAESEGLGRGAQFHFTLPLADQWRGVGDVLIIENDSGFARLLAEEMESQGLVPALAESVDRAREHLESGFPRAVILDASFLPRMDEASIGHVPIIVVTVQDLAESEQAAIEGRGARVVLCKGPGAAAAVGQAVTEALAEQAASALEATP